MTTIVNRRSTGLSAALISLLVATAACGGAPAASSPVATSAAPSATADASPTSAASSSAGAEGGVAEAQQIVDAAKEVPTVKFGSDVPVAGSILKDKDVWIVSAGQNIDFNVSVEAGALEALKILGAKTNVLDSRSNQATMDSNIGVAVASGADAIILSSIDPAKHSGPLQAAQDAGIPVVTMFGADPNIPLAPGTFADATISYNTSGKLQAAYAVAHGQGKVNAVLFDLPEHEGTHLRFEGMESELLRLCPSCTYSVQVEQAVNIQNDLGPRLKSAIQRDPSINYVLTSFDAEASLAIVALREIGATETIHIVSGDGQFDNLDEVRAGNQLADVGEPLAFAGWAAVDEVLRALNGKERGGTQVPLRILDASNLEGTPNDELALYGGEFKAAFQELWGVN